MDRKTLAAAFPYTVPVLMGYLSIGIVFGWMMSSIGYNPLWSVAMSATIYAGSGQYLSMLEKFKGMGWRKLYMIFSLTDETYALLAGVRPPDGVDEKKFYFIIALLDQAYWIAGSLAGAVAGSLITINTEGIDFAMTALFIVIAVDQWRSARKHFPALLGAGGTLVCLLWLGPDGGRFLIPALGILVAGLLLARPMLDRSEPAQPCGKGGSPV